jgi:hypothetical protein
VRTVATALARLRELGILNWVRRCAERWADGRFVLEQETNAYAVLPESQWQGYRPPPEASAAPWPPYLECNAAHGICARPGGAGDRSCGQGTGAGGQRHDAAGASLGLLPAQHPCARLVSFTGVHEMRRNTL